MSSETSTLPVPQMTRWDHKDLWIRRATTFAVEVSRHGAELSSISPELGPHRWCVYAYIYPTHPRFSRFYGDSLFQAACEELPMHGGVIRASYLRCHYSAKGPITCVQVGSDYNHLYDERFTHLTPEEAGEVFDDAEALFRFLESEASSVPNAPENQPAAQCSSKSSSGGRA